MGRAPCCDKTQVKRGPWSPEEDDALIRYIQTHGSTGNWIALPQKAGLNRCGKSCRLRWLNYLRPDIKHGCFTPEEDNIICTLYSQMGSRWSIIASQLPGRTDNDVKNHWNTRLKKKLMATTGNTITSQVNAVPATTDKLFPVSYKSRSGDPIETSHSFSYFVASKSQNYRPLPEFSNHLHSYGLTNSTHKLANSVPLAQVSGSEVTDQMGNYSQEGSSNVSGNGEIVDQEAEILAEFGFEVPYDENVIGPIFHESSPDEVPYADMISPSSQGITSPSVANLYY